MLLNPCTCFLLTKVFSTVPNFELQCPQQETYTGPDPATHCLDYVTKVADLTHEALFKNPKNFVITPEIEHDLTTADRCHICEKRYSFLRSIAHCHNQDEDAADCSMCRINALIESSALIRPIAHCHIQGQDHNNCALCQTNKMAKENPVVPDHCHFSADYRGASHSKCNLQYNVKESRFVLPVFFHNLRGFDGHLLVQALKPRHGKVRIIPTNMEKYLAVQVGRVLFLDSMQDFENF